MLRGSRLVALVAAACCCTVSDALLLGPHPPCHRRVAAASTAGRVRSLRCEEAMPEEVAKNIPPEMLAAAWEREEEAKELSKLLKGCQVHHCTACTTPPLELAPTGVSAGRDRHQHVQPHLSGGSPFAPADLPQVYLVGLSTRKIAVGRALARRLQTYRLLDAPALMLSTYKAP